MVNEIQTVIVCVGKHENEAKDELHYNSSTLFNKCINIKLT